MKVLLINGSPRIGGNTSILLEEMIKVFEENNIETEVIKVGDKDIRGCMACGYCSQRGMCCFNDLVNETSLKFESADGLVVAAPVYFGSPNGTVISFLDRLFRSSKFSKKMKVGAAFAIARRGGTTASFDVLNKYFTIAGMPVASGDYWNNGFGLTPGEIKEDKEGLRNARVVAKRMVFLMNAIKDANEKYPKLLEDEDRVATHFIKNK